MAKQYALHFLINSRSQLISFLVVRAMRSVFYFTFFPTSLLFPGPPCQSFSLANHSKVSWTTKSFYFLWLTYDLQRRDDVRYDQFCMIQRHNNDGVHQLNIGMQHAQLRRALWTQLFSSWKCFWFSAPQIPLNEVNRLRRCKLCHSSGDGQICDPHPHCTWVRSTTIPPTSYSCGSI